MWKEYLEMLRRDLSETACVKFVNIFSSCATTCRTVLICPCSANTAGRTGWKTSRLTDKLMDRLTNRDTHIYCRRTAKTVKQKRILT